MLTQHGLGPKSIVVDLGGGSGTFAEAIAPLCGRVAVVDVSTAMLGALSARVEQQGSSNIEVVQAELLDCPSPLSDDQHLARNVPYRQTEDILR